MHLIADFLASLQTHHDQLVVSTHEEHLAEEVVIYVCFSIGPTYPVICFSSLILFFLMTVVKEYYSFFAFT
jgi:hypothetical protein